MKTIATIRDSIKARQVPCPECGAVAGELCRRRTIRASRTAHRGRLAALVALSVAQ